MADKIYIGISVVVMFAVIAIFANPFVPIDTNSIGLGLMMFSGVVIAITKYLSQKSVVVDSNKTSSCLVPTRLSMKDGSITATGVINSDGEAIMSMSRSARWNMVDMIIMDKEDYDKNFSMGKEWEIFSESFITRVNDKLKSTRVGDDLQIVITATSLSRLSGNTNEYEMVLSTLIEMVYQD